MTELEKVYFPTSVMFIDDDRNFLLNFTLKLDEDIMFEIKHSPQEALDIIHARQPSKIIHPELALQQRQNHLEFDTRKSGLNISEVGKEIFNPLRFSEIAVVVVDYEMPNMMSGLEFISKMENSRIKRILLTGQTKDADLAQRAIEDGLVDVYIHKHSADVHEQVNKGIKRLQHDYFQEMSKLVMRTLPSSSENHMPLDSEPFIHFFKKIIKDNNIVEYYLNDELGSMLLVSETGKISIIQSCVEKDIQTCVEAAKAHGVKKSTLKEMASGKKIPFVNHNGRMNIDWSHIDSFLFETKRIQADETYFCNYIPSTAIENTFGTAKILSYNEYMNM